MYVQLTERHEEGSEDRLEFFRQAADCQGRQARLCRSLDRVGVSCLAVSPPCLGIGFCLAEPFFCGYYECDSDGALNMISSSNFLM